MDELSKKGMLGSAVAEIKSPVEKKKKSGTYTRKGDNCKTLLGNSVVEKTHRRIRAIASLDELSAIIGCIRFSFSTGKNSKLYLSIQEDLFLISAIIRLQQGIEIDQDRISFIEELIDETSAKLLPLDHFVLPGGFYEPSRLYYARAVCRRAEIDIVDVHIMNGGVPSNVLVYMNRLSDLLFVLARNGNVGKDVLFHKENVLKGQ